MTTHELAKLLLIGPDVPAVLADDRVSFEVVDAFPSIKSFHGANDTAKVQRDSMGYQVPRRCVGFKVCDHAPTAANDLKAERARDRKRDRDRKRMTKEQFNLVYGTIQPMTPAMFAEQGKKELEFSKGKKKGKKP